MDDLSHRNYGLTCFLLRKKCIEFGASKWGVELQILGKKLKCTSSFRNVLVNLRALDNRKVARSGR